MIALVSGAGARGAELAVFTPCLLESTYTFKDNILTIWDNPDNTAQKASTAKDLNLAGCMLYALSGDNGDLVDAMIKSC